MQFYLKFVLIILLFTNFSLIAFSYEDHNHNDHHHERAVAFPDNDKKQETDQYHSENPRLIYQDDQNQAISPKNGSITSSDKMSIPLSIYRQMMNMLYIFSAINRSEYQLINNTGVTLFPIT